MAQNTKTADGEALKKLTKQIDQSFETVAKLSGSNLPPTDFYQDFLNKVISGIEAKAGAIWLRTPQGFLQLQCQTHIEKVGLDEKKGGRQTHNELLRRAFQGNRPVMLEPYGRVGSDEGPLAANMTEFLVILAPILQEDGQPVGLVEVWQEPYIDPRIHPTYMNYVVQMAGYASNYNRNASLRKVSGQEQAWTDLEKFSKVIHTSLNPTEVAFQIANEGRRLVQCDRISVGIRHSGKTTIEAVSGADVVEKSSTHVKRMRILFDKVINWGERLTFNGTRDETLPPSVLHALDAYLAESNPKLLVLQPLRDDRENTKDTQHKKCRSALLMECYEPPEKIEPLINRMEIVSGHAASALYNAAEMKRIPLKFLWGPIAAVQDGLGGKTRFWTFVITSLVILVTLAMILVPYPLKLDAKGNLLPAERVYIYTPHPGQVREFHVNQGDLIYPSTPIATMFDQELFKQMNELETSIEGLRTKIGNTNSMLNSSMMNMSGGDRGKMQMEREVEERKLRTLREQLANLQNLYKYDTERKTFQVCAPEFKRSRGGASNPEWAILTADFRENFTNKRVEPNAPMIRVGNKSGAWEIEMKIPQKHVGQLRKAFTNDNQDSFLEVDVLVKSAPDRKFKGRIYQRSIAGEAVPNRDDNNESEPVVYAYVTVNEEGINSEYHIPKELLTPGVEVKTKIICGDHQLGYSLFYGVWEFFYEHVIFFF